MTRAITAPELALLRTPGHRSELFLAIHIPDVVYTARVLSTPSSTDMVTQIPFYVDDCLEGDIADVLPGMTLLVGTTPYGHERGIIRIREAVAGTPFEVSEGSSIDIQADDYLTVLDEFSIWPRHLKLSGTIPLMDSNIAYASQHTNFKPVPVLGPDRVVWLTDTTVTVEFDASDSWVLDSTISGYAWTATGASASADMDTATPTITYNVEGTYRVDLVITAANGETETTHRNVFVYSNAVMPVTDFELKSCGGSVSDGGWSFNVEMSGQSTLTSVRDRAKVILFARDYYGNTEQSIGYLDGCENIITWGWIAEESILWHPEKGRVAFTVQGAQYWLKAITLFPVWIEQKVGTSDAWTNMSSLTVNKVYHHLMTWRTTFVQCCDFFKSDDTRNASRLESGAGDVWSQIQFIVRETILAEPLCNRFNQLFINIDPQVSASRSFPVVQTLTTVDWLGSIELERRTVDELSMLSLSGISVNTGNAAISYFALANGHVFKRYGRTDTMERLLLSSQAQANSLAGMILAWRNNPYPPFGIRLAGNNRMFDICPQQFASIVISSTDTDREIEYTGHLIPRSVAFDHEKGTLYAKISFEAETFEDLNIDGDIPGGAEFPAESPLARFKMPKFPAIPALPVIGGVTFPTGTAPARVLVHDKALGMLYTENFNANPSTGIIWQQMNWGLVAADYQIMHSMILLPSGGVWLANGSQPYPDPTGIWYASSPGSPYTKLLDRQQAADLWNGGPADITISPWNYTRIERLGYNKNTASTILFNISYGSGAGEGTMAGGDSSGSFSLPDALEIYSPYVSYGGGAWVGFGSVYGVRKLSSTGAWVQDYPLSPGWLQTRIGTSDEIYLFGSGIYGGIVQVSGNGASIGAESDVGMVLVNLATDASGQYVMAIGSSVKKSSDHASSFGGALSFPPSTINIPRNAFCVDADRWIVVGGSVSAAYSPIVYSPDFGTTWENKYGNLGALFPSTAFDFDLVQALP